MDGELDPPAPPGRHARARAIGGHRVARHATPAHTAGTHARAPSVGGAHRALGGGDTRHYDPALAYVCLAALCLLVMQNLIKIVCLFASVYVGMVAPGRVSPGVSHPARNSGTGSGQRSPRSIGGPLIPSFWFPRACVRVLTGGV